MAKTFADLIREKRTHAAYHEAGHYVIGRLVSPGTSITTIIDNIGHGDFWIEFTNGTARAVKLEVAVAGFLAEAKGIAEANLSNEYADTRAMAVQVNRLLREGRPAFQVDVILTAGDPEPAATNQKDFSFLLEDVNRRMRSFKALLGMDSWANEIQDAIRACVPRLQTAATWAQVEQAKDHLLAHGWLSTEG